MHELGKFIQHLMDRDGMTPPELMRRSGLTRQHVHSLLTEDSMVRMPTVKTFTGLGRAFPAVPPASFVLAAAAAIGIPVDGADIADQREISNETLLAILKARLEGGSTHEDLASPAQKSPESADAGDEEAIEVATRDDFTPAALEDEYYRRRKAQEDADPDPV